jgi:pyroglutamyl-peptidase
MRRTCVHLTGFGPFMDVVDNPSAHIARDLAKALPPSAELVSVHELEVSMRGVDDYFAQEMLLLNEEAGKLTVPAEGAQVAPKEVQHLFVHFGVHRGARGEIRLEVRGQNEAHFPDGDMNGVVRNHAPIDDSQCVGSCIESSLDQEELRKIAACINSETQPEDGRLAPRLAVTYDAGQYLCNYCLYRSTMNMTILNEKVAGRSGGRSFVSIFIHVLDPERGDAGPGGQHALNPTIEKQVEVIGRLLQHLVNLLQT